MEPRKVILFYRFVRLSDPDAIRLWQRELCEGLGLKGRILLSVHGINGTLGGEMTALTAYIRRTKEYPAFKGTDFKWSEGTGDEFPRLRIRVRDELVAFGASSELEVDGDGVVGGGTRLTPRPSISWSTGVVTTSSSSMLATPSRQRSVGSRTRSCPTFAPPATS